MPMAVSPNHRFLYAGLRSQPFTVASFAIDSATGGLTHLGNAPLADSMAYIVTDRSGRFLLSASYPGSKLAINPIDAQGKVQGETTQIIPTKPKAHCILVDPTNKYCYATSLGGDIVMQWKFDAATGRLSPNSPDSIALPAGNGPGIWRFTRPGNSFIWSPRPPRASPPLPSIRVPGRSRRSRSSTPCRPTSMRSRQLRTSMSPPMGASSTAASVNRTPWPGSTIDEPTGKLSLIGRWPTEKTPRGFNIDPRGRFLLSVGLDSNAMTVHKIDPQTGALSVAHQYPMGKMPNWVEIVDLK